MANITPNQQGEDGNTHRYVWSNVNTGDVCLPAQHPGAPDRTVQVFGTFGGASVGFNGTLEDAPANYFPLTKDGTNAIAIVAAGGSIIAENTNWTQPVVTGGAASGLTIITSSAMTPCSRCPKMSYS